MQHGGAYLAIVAVTASAITSAWAVVRLPSGLHVLVHHLVGELSNYNYCVS